MRFEGGSLDPIAAAVSSLLEGADAHPPVGRAASVAHSSSQTSTRFWPVKWLGVRCQPLTFLWLTTMR